MFGACLTLVARRGLIRARLRGQMAPGVPRPGINTRHSTYSTHLHARSSSSIFRQTTILRPLDDVSARASHRHRRRDTHSVYRRICDVGCAAPGFGRRKAGSGRALPLHGETAVNYARISLVLRGLNQGRKEKNGSHDGAIKPCSCDILMSKKKKKKIAVHRRKQLFQLSST